MGRLMPDTHAGMPIGGVIAADGVVIPNAMVAAVWTSACGDQHMKCVVADIRRLSRQLSSRLL